VVVIRLGVREPESWLWAFKQAGTASQPAGDTLHHRMGDLREMLGDRRWRRHLLLGMTLGIAGQTGIWGIGFWSPELIRAAALEERQREASEGRGRNPGERPTTLDQLASLTTTTPADALAALDRWRAEDDRYVGRATVLQDCAGMLGIYAFTWFTGLVGRRPAFATAYLLGLGATVVVFGFLSSAAQSYWMMPLLGFGVSSVFGGFAIYFPELFPTRLRSTGTGFCYNVARYITALGPLTLGKLTLVFGSLGFTTPLRPAAIMLSLVYLVGLAALPFAPETKGQPLPE
jgi:hypothetical protein